MGIPFLKMSGAGNDFIVFDDRSGDCKGISPAQRADICSRRTGVGADGILLIAASECNDFRMVFFNSDGAEGRMCGNGARCLAWAAEEIGLGRELTAAFPRPEGWELPAGVDGEQLWSISFEAADGCHNALGWGERVMVTIGSVSESRDLILETGAGRIEGALLDVGVPHFISLTDDPQKVPLNSLGPMLRSHQEFDPDGANVNFLAGEPDEEGAYAIRTFERGVEGETLSCGTGAAAAAAVLARNGASPPVSLRAPGGILTVHFKSKKRRIEDIWLEGPVKVIYRGELEDI